MDEFLEQFVLEAREQSEEATRNLLTLGSTPGDADSLDNVFRAFHTIKGGAGIVEFDALVETMHRAESGLADAKAGRRAVDTALIDACFRCLDQVARWLDLVEQIGAVPDEAALQLARSPDPPTDTPAHASTDDSVADSADVPADVATEVPADDPADGPVDVARALLASQGSLLTRAQADGLPARIASAGRVAANALRSLGRTAAAADIERVATGCLRTADAAPLRLAIAAQLAPGGAAVRHDAATEHGATTVHQAEQASGATTAPGKAIEPGATTDAGPATRTLRIDVARVDALVRLTGELTIATNAIGHIARPDEGERTSRDELRRCHATLDRLIGQLQQSVLGLRVLPLRQVFQRIERLTRELSTELHKPVALDIEGADTEADKVIVEALFEPMLHVLRNAMDHGIETTAQRQQVGKPPIAAVSVRASRQGDEVVIDITDDGQGVDVERVRAVAMQRGLRSAEALAAMDDGALLDLIFQPGFSTSAGVSTVSGRGVGMDAVRHAIQRLGGRVGIASQPGVGTHVRFTLPFSALLMRIMTVTAAGQQFGVPFDDILETVPVNDGSIIAVGTSQAVVLRNHTVPVVDLAEALDLYTREGPWHGTARNGAGMDRGVLVVVRSQGQPHALHVDGIGERHDVMLSRLQGLLEGAPGITGSTVLGDGRVLLVLDPSQLV